MTPGVISTYNERIEDGEGIIVVEFTLNTKEILGVSCIVVRDTVSVDGEMVEDTYDWYAQGGDGNVWYFGENSTEYEAVTVSFGNMSYAIHDIN